MSPAVIFSWAARKRPDTRARLLQSCRSLLLGVQFGLQHPFQADLVEGSYAAAEPAGYRVQVALSAVTPGRSEQHAVDALLGDRCEALILLGPQATARGSTRSPSRSRSSASQAGSSRRPPGGGSDPRRRRCAAGRRPSRLDRRRGYRNAMKRHCLGDHIRVQPGGPTEEDGAAATRTLLTTSGRRPTAVLASVITPYLIVVRTTTAAASTAESA